MDRIEAWRAMSDESRSEAYAAFAHRHGLVGWEGRYSPYDEQTYQAVLEAVTPTDVVFDIGAGDLQLAVRMAAVARQVIAVEVNPVLVGQALASIGLDLPRNLHVVCANALDMPVPPGVTLAVLLMRHCAHFGAYFDRLRAAGCRRLVTNARWKSGVEEIALQTPRRAFEDVHTGWYACRCGAVGYAEGAGEGEVDAPPVAPPVEVASCPTCRPTAKT